MNSRAWPYAQILTVKLRLTPLETPDRTLHAVGQLPWFRRDVVHAGQEAV